MDHRDVALCPKYHRAIELIGRRWSGAIVLGLVRRGPCRFSELLAAIPGVSDRLLTERLRELEEQGVLIRRVQSERPVRVTYELSEAGKALEPAIGALQAWAERWIEPPAESTQPRVSA